jgi:hypothetical protein
VGYFLNTRIVERRERLESPGSFGKLALFHFSIFEIPMIKKIEPPEPT